MRYQVYSGRLHEVLGKSPADAAELAMLNLRGFWPSLLVVNEVPSGYLYLYRFTGWRCSRCGPNCTGECDGSTPAFSRDHEADNTSPTDRGDTRFAQAPNRADMGTCGGAEAAVRTATREAIRKFTKEASQ